MYKVRCCRKMKVEIPLVEPIAKFVGIELLELALNILTDVKDTTLPNTYRRKHFVNHILVFDDIDSTISSRQIPRCKLDLMIVNIHKSQNGHQYIIG